MKSKKEREREGERRPTLSTFVDESMDQKEVEESTCVL